MKCLLAAVLDIISPSTKPLWSLELLLLQRAVGASGRTGFCLRSSSCTWIAQPSAHGLLSRVLWKRSGYVKRSSLDPERRDVSPLKIPVIPCSSSSALSHTSYILQQLPGCKPVHMFCIFDLSCYSVHT